LSRNAASYCPRPRLRSQTTTSMMAPELRLGAYHRWRGSERSQGDVGVRRTAKGPEAASGGKTDSARTSLRVSSCHRLALAVATLRTVNAAVAEDITSIATAHDSFGCLPSRAERFRKIIRKQFVRMYEDNDAPPERGTLNIKKVLDAEFAFA